ncbi:MAG: DUF3137 domain-containing protein [Proteobacteria bacterium]|nr:DUF3137 domain-containing protein [Pseudomonadota bacterium]
MAALAIAVIVWLLSNQSLGGAGAALLIAGVIAYAWAAGPLTAVGRRVKQSYCEGIAQAMGASYRMSDFAPPAFDRFEQWKLTPSYSRSHFEDWFSGGYKGSSYDLYEGRLEQRHTDSKGRTYYSTVFRGQLVRMHFPREFLGVTVVRRDMGIFNAFGGQAGLEKVGLEDPKFEKAFEVWGSDQVEARYLLHPALMQRLLDLEARMKGEKLRCAFQGGDLLVAIEGGNRFEPGDLFKPLNDPARARRIIDDVASVMRVMDEALSAQARRV